MKRTCNIMLLALVATLLCSCDIFMSKSNIALHPYVSKLLSDTLSVERAMVQAWQPSSTGDITIVGESKRASHFATTLSQADFFDNISGASRSDSLRDFASERISVVIDEVNSPFQTLYDSLGQVALSEVLLRNMVLSMEDSLAISPKIFIVDTPMASCLADFRVLLSSFGKHCDLIVPRDAVVQEVKASSLQHSTVAIWTENDLQAFYLEAFADAGLSYLELPRTPLDLCDSLSLEEASEEMMLSSLDLLVRQRPAVKLGTLIVDDPTLSAVIPYLNEFLKTILRSSDPRYFPYQAVLERDFVIRDAEAAAARAIYRTLRGQNLLSLGVRPIRINTYTTIQTNDKTPSGGQLPWRLSQYSND